ncbi:MAG: hypothetical protein JWL83_2011 [Actinomycetia bacterium]|nr:hypothetical protein [Actinomycetes bacterium]
MTPGRLAFLLELVGVREEIAVPLPQRVCAACVEATSVTGAALALVSHGGQGGTIAASDARIRSVDDEQFTFGEGPGISAFATGEVLESDLATSRAVSAWPAFTRHAQAAGIGAAFGFPLLRSGLRVGSLDLYRDTAGALTGDELGDARALAVIATVVVTEIQSHAPNAGEQLHPDLERGMGRAIVHQATGMVMVQLGVTIAEAIILLRAYAFSHERPIFEIAADIVARRLRLE